MIVPVIGGIVALVGIVDMGDVSSSGAEFFGQEIKPSVGWGLWLVVVGGAGAVLTAFATNLGIAKA